MPPGGDRRGAAPANVMAFARPTTVRFLILGSALLTAGLVIGTSLHNVVFRRPWSEALASCAARQGPAEPVPVCMAPLEQRRVLMTLGVVVVLALAALVVVLVRPRWTEWRRNLVPVEPKYHAALHRAASLAQRSGVRHPPTLTRSVKRTTLVEPFAYGRPGHYRVAIPTKVLLNPDKDLFSAAVGHEMAHLAHHDVALSWLARSLWYPLAPLLAVPVLTAVYLDDYSMVPDYLWRCVVLVAVVLLAQFAVLRVREHEADLRSVWDAGDSSALTAELLRGTGLHLPIWRRWHPSAEARVAMLRDPRRLSVVGFLDPFVAAFLVMLALPVVSSLLGAAGLRNLGTTAPAGISAALGGALLGVTLGLALWRQSALTDEPVGPARVAPAAAGVFLGAYTGQAVSLSEIGLSHPALRDTLLSFLPMAAGLFAATVVLAGLGELWARDRRLDGAGSTWLVAAACGIVLVGTALWATQVITIAARTGGEQYVRWSVHHHLGTGATVLAAAALAGAAGLALTHRAQPAGAARTLAVALPAGVAGALLCFLAKAADDAAAGGWAAAAVAAVTGAAAAWATGAVRLLGGIGEGLVVGPLATVIAASPVAFAGDAAVVQRAVALGFLIYLATAWLALLGALVRQAAAPRTVAAAVAAVLVLVTGSAVHAGRARLSPPAALPSPAPPAVAGSLAAFAYRARTGPNLFKRRDALVTRLTQIDTDPSISNAVRVQRMRVEILLPLRQLLTEARAYGAPNAKVADVHRHCVAALDSAVVAVEHFISAYETGDRRHAETGLRLWDEQIAQWLAWQEGVEGL